MEIERKFEPKKIPAEISSHPCLFIEQAYLCTDPVIRIRRQDDEYYMTYKGKGLMAREEYNLPLNPAAYAHLLTKADGNIISKKRFLIPIEHPCFTADYPAPKEPIGLKIELDVFDPPFAPLVIAEVEFQMKRWLPPLFPRSGWGKT